jgi:cation:H+ antiporter
MLGFLMLVFGADFLVDGSASLAKKFGVSNLVIGLTLVAVGTSFPELMVSLQSNLNGTPNLAVANIFGSNITNILLILGIVSVLFTVKVSKSTVLTEIPFLILSLLILFFLSNDFLANGLSRTLPNSTLYLSRADGVVLLTFFSVFLYYTYTLLKKSKVAKKEEYFNVFEEEQFSLASFVDKILFRPKKNRDVLTIGEVNVYGILKSAFFVMLGFVFLYLGGRFIVDSITEIAIFLKLPDYFLGLTVVAFGTSVPELATSITAFRKNNADMAVGNIIGSNIFNTLFVLGTVAFIKPLEFSVGFNYDILVALVSSVTLALVLFFSKSKTLGKAAGVFFIWGYFLYLMFKFTSL